MASKNSITGFCCWPAGPSLLYLLSAACLLVGAVMVITPIYGNSKLVNEKLYLVATVNFYELALLVVTLLVCCWKSGNDDAISLTTLIAVFLVGSAIALDTIAIDFPSIAMMLGLGAIFLAMAKFFALQRFVTRSIDPLLLTAIGLFLLPNFIMPAVLGFCVEKNLVHISQILPFWTIGWILTLVASFVLLFKSININDGDAASQDQEKPILHRAIMHWSIALIILLASFVHQYTLCYSFDIRLQFGDYFPAFLLIIIVLVEFKRIYFGPLGPAALVILCLPNLLALLAIHGGRRLHPIIPSVITGGWLLAPTAIIFFCALAFSLLAWIGRRRQSLFYVAAIYLVTSSWLYCTPSMALLLFEVGIASMAIALWKRHVGLAIVSIVLFSLALGKHPQLVSLANNNNLGITPVCFIAFGTAMLIIYSIYRRYRDATVVRLFAWLGLLLMVTGVFYCFFSQQIPLFYYPFTAGIFAVAIVGASTYFTRDWSMLILAAIPLLYNLGRYLPKSKGWLVIIGSFVLLGTGALFSFIKSKNKTENNEMLGDGF